MCCVCIFQNKLIDIISSYHIIYSQTLSSLSWSSPFYSIVIVIIIIVICIKGIQLLEWNFSSRCRLWCTTTLSMMLLAGCKNKLEKLWVCGNITTRCWEAEMTQKMTTKVWLCRILSKYFCGMLLFYIVPNIVY